MNILSIVIQIIGTLIMYFNSPINKPDQALIFASNPDMNKINKKNKNLRYGILILTIGLILQFISAALDKC